MKFLNTAGVTPHSGSDLAGARGGGQEQETQLALAESQRTLALNVMDTGSTVEFPQAVGESDADVDNLVSGMPVLHTRPRSGSNHSSPSSGQRAAEFDGESGVADQPRDSDSRVSRLAPSNEGEHRRIDDAGEQLEVASDAVGNDGAGLPYAVILTLLALIGLVPVARRNDQHHRM